MSVKSFKTGTRSVSLLAGNTPEHHVLIAESTVGSGGAASVTFSNIPADYQHLQIRGISRFSASGSFFFIQLTANGVTGTNYAAHTLGGDGANASSSAYTSRANAVIDYMPMSGITANVFGAFVTDVLDYVNTSKNKTFRTLSGTDANGSGLIGLHSGFLNSTNAITSLTLTPNSGNFVQHTTISLYGVK